jgi:MFS family permease
MWLMRTSVEAGYIASATLLTSALGGWGAGILADRFGAMVMLAAWALPETRGRALGTWAGAAARDDVRV